MSRDPQKVWLSRADREALREYAWANRTHMGAVVNAAIQDVRDHPRDLAGLSATDSKSEVQLSVIVDADLWVAAHEAADESGVGSFSALVRRRIRKILFDEGYLK